MKINGHRWREWRTHILCCIMTCFCFLSYSLWIFFLSVMTNFCFSISASSFALARISLLFSSASCEVQFTNAWKMYRISRVAILEGEITPDKVCWLSIKPQIRGKWRRGGASIFEKGLSGNPNHSVSKDQCNTCKMKLRICSICFFAASSFMFAKSLQKIPKRKKKNFFWIFYFLFFNNFVWKRPK